MQFNMPANNNAGKPSKKENFAAVSFHSQKHSPAVNVEPEREKTLGN
jgi:hypothetical protein